jgi:hypothetical protein
VLTDLRDVARRAGRAAAVWDVLERVAPGVRSLVALEISIVETLNRAWEQRED